MPARFQLLPATREARRARPAELVHESFASGCDRLSADLSENASARNDVHPVNGSRLEPARRGRQAYGAREAMLGMALESGRARQCRIDRHILALDADQPRHARGQCAGLVEGDQAQPSETLERARTAYDTAEAR